MTASSLAMVHYEAFDCLLAGLKLPDFQTPLLDSGESAGDGNSQFFRRLPRLQVVSSAELGGALVCEGKSSELGKPLLCCVRRGDD